jgi:hypothetical protein
LYLSIIIYTRLKNKNAINGKLFFNLLDYRD